MPFYPFRAGISFVAVHDSYWTHPCFVDTMNKVSCFLFFFPVAMQLATVHRRHATQLSLSVYATF